MKSLNYLFLSLFLCANVFAQDSIHNKQESKFFQKALYGTVIVGAAGSLIFWGLSAIDVIKCYGFSVAIQTTHVPRVVIDALTIAACAVAFNEVGKQEEKKVTFNFD